VKWGVKRRGARVERKRFLASIIYGKRETILLESISKNDFNCRKQRNSMAIFRSLDLKK
jgi:hypothetical protein